MAKRSIDVVLGTAASLATLPVVLVFALVLAVELRAWPFFVQERVGLGGRTFRIIKLRTLPPTTPTDADKYALREVQIPRFASKLRATHLDELPQLWLVVLGTMSLVGPRPEMPGLHSSFDAHVQQERSLVRPGCTGLWQVSVAAGGLMHEHPEYDLAYVRATSLRLDTWILWQTVLMVVGVGGGLTLADAPLRSRVPDVLVLSDEPVAIPVEDRAAV